MGLWWKFVGVKAPTDVEKRVEFTGDPKALSKRWPILWRFCQNWHFLRVEGGTRYRLFFRDERGRVMQYRQWLFTSYVAVRVGPRPVMFWALDEREEALPVRYMSVMIPGVFRDDTRDSLMVHYGEHYRPRTTFI